ncbi:UNVERIFIED_CONTAM: hypothetical protein HHA_451140 [Hammondia hammondi]|eukprot:XP_008883770.1 hypothetical protein HHA_451140 [Hammondia hammondi]
MKAQRQRFYSEAAASYPSPATRYADEVPKTLYQLEFRPPLCREETVIKTFVEDGLKHCGTRQGDAARAKQIERQEEIGAGVTCGQKSECITTINKALQVPHHRYERSVSHTGVRLVGGKALNFERRSLRAMEHFLFR